MRFAPVAALEALLEHRLLDRLLRARVTIALVAFALIGIVTLQLGLLKLNGGIGRALEREATLQRQNAALNIEDSELASADHVETMAARIGMRRVPDGALRFLAAGAPQEITNAAAALRGSVPGGGGEGSQATAAGTQESAGPTPSNQASSGEPSQASSGEPSAPSASTSSAGAEAAPASGEEHGSPSLESSSTSASAPTPAPAPSAAPSAPAAGSSPEAGAGGGTQAGPQG